MKDENYIKRFCKRFGLEVKEFNEHGFIAAEAIRCGAVKTLYVQSKKGCSIIDFPINEEGNCVGTFTDNRNSFVAKETT